MKISALILPLLGISLCSCEPSPKILVGGIHPDPTLIPEKETLRISEELLTNRYPQARFVEGRITELACTYRFATNGEISSEVIVVDRKTGKARFENLSQ